MTTVGYGDVTPANALGRLVDAVFMLEAIAFVAIVTAAITSSFVERAQRERAAESRAGDVTGLKQVAAQLSEITARLERIQQILEPGESAGGRRG